MARKLSHLSQPIARYANKRFSRKKKVITIKNDIITLPNILKPAYLQGHALFIREVFTAFEKRHFKDPLSQIHFWEQLTEKK